MVQMYPRVIRQALALAGGALAVFHGWLFVSQAAAGRLEDPWLIFRWIAAASLIAALVAVRRSGDSVWGRKGIAIWLLAALLHGPAVAGKTDLGSIALPETVATSVVQLLAATALAVGLLALARLRRSRRRPVPISTYVSSFAAALQLAAAITLQFSPRPPPLRL
jgi:hypothetical protein